MKCELQPSRFDIILSDDKVISNLDMNHIRLLYSIIDEFLNMEENGGDTTVSLVLNLLKENKLPMTLEQIYKNFPNANRVTIRQALVRATKNNIVKNVARGMYKYIQT